jgi:hypothetical protein
LLASCSSLDPHLLKVRLLPQTTIISSLHWPHIPAITGGNGVWTNIKVKFP